MAGPGATLQHRPDIVLRGLRGQGSYTIIDVKTLDPELPQRRRTRTCSRLAIQHGQQRTRVAVEVPIVLRLALHMLRLALN